MPINFNDIDKINFDDTVYREVTKASDNTSAATQDNSNVTYDNFLLHSSKEWLSTLENNSTDLIKDAKDTASKIKGDSKVIGATKKAAPDTQPFKEIEKKLYEGLTNLNSSTAAMVDINKYSGAINYISSTAIKFATGAININADMGMTTKSPSISTTTNVNVTNAATNINYSDTTFNKTDRDITVTNQQLTSASDKHSVVTNTTSMTSTDNKTSAVNSHQVITNEQKQYSKALTTLTSESITIASKGNTSINSQGGLVISDGQSLKSGASQASTLDTPESIGGVTDGGVTGNVAGESLGAAAAAGSIKILSTGSIDTQATGIVSTQGDTVGTNAVKIGMASVDFASNSTTTTISSKTQSALISEAITYTGNRNMGISINPFGILAGTGVAPLIPLLTELLPPIIVDVPELPEFPFGSLADFLSKCLPFTSPVDLGSSASTTTTPSTTPNINIGDGELLEDVQLTPAEPPPLEIAPEPPLVTLEPQPSPLEGPALEPASESAILDEPVDISLEEPLVTQDKSTNSPAVAKGTVAEQKERDITTTPNTSTGKDKPTFTSKQAVTNAAKLGMLHTVYANTPEDKLNNKTTTTISTSDVTAITPKQSYTESLKSLTSLQQAEVVNSFNPSVKTNISSSYSDFLKAVAIVDVFGPTTSPDYSKTVNDFLSNSKLVQEIKTFLNTKRPIGVGGQQPPNIQDDISNPISDLNTGGNAYVKTPPVIGQGLVDLATWAANTSALAKSSIPSTTENWLNSDDEDFDNYDFEFGDDLTSNIDLSSISSLLNNQYVDLIKSVIPDNKIQSALSLTQDIAAGKITTPQEYANRLASLVGGEVGGYIAYAEQALNIYEQVQAGNYTSLLGIPGVSNVLGSKGTAVASKVLGLISKKNITDKDIYEVAGSIFTALTGIGIPLLDELAKLLGCIDSIKQNQPFLQSISNPDLQDIIDYLPRIIQTTTSTNRTVLNITPNNCNQISELTAEEATINMVEIGPSYIKFRLDNKDLIQFNSKPLPTIGTPVNVYTEFYSDRVTNLVLLPYKIGSQFTSNIIEYRITNKIGDIYTANLINTNTTLTLEDNISGSLYAYTTHDIGNRLAPYVLDSYILL
jgi:hypothetical protein